MIRLVGYAWLFAAAGFLTWVTAMCARALLHRHDQRLTARARKQATLRSIRDSRNAAPLDRGGHAHRLPDRERGA